MSGTNRVTTRVRRRPSCSWRGLLTTLEAKRRRAWQNMIRHAHYHRQHVHPPWRYYDRFAKDLGLPPAGDFWLRKIDAKAGFTPGNVAWLKGRGQS